ncbi:MAG TPA: LysR family transcriptional regulator [Pusillimonas sp.]|nr:LysR family transcriptional regulator [Pusillimonas sp.]MBC41982.1 LysR family transcriptional regulator [Pusillimonas sp.]HBT31712.1 LysR family transcriptional regulator [Pusillimonas sp.]HCN70942.1 LysR family transcriptional regulator [Pusillimonas sp.]HCP79540.1 LysR family transcriptional regulator [Pusillimonas sp.]
MLNLNALPPLKALRAFEAAARHLNFRLAAQELHVTQGAVAQHVRGLESALGVALFQRQPRRLVLTEKGRRYHLRVREAFEMIEQATDDLMLKKNRVTVSVTPTFAAKWLLPRLSAFAEEHAAIDLRIQASEGLADFHADGVDIAVRQMKMPAPAQLQATLLLRYEAVVVCSPTLKRNIKVFDDLWKQLLLVDLHDLWPRLAHQSGLSGVPPSSKTIHFNQTSLAIDAALAGQGVALVPRCFIKTDIEQGRLVTVGRQVVNYDTDFYLVAPVSLNAASEAHVVWHWLKEQAGV